MSFTNTSSRNEVFRKQGESEELIERLSNEANILNAVAHPNIVEFLGATITDDKASLRLARIDGVPLDEAQLDLDGFTRVIMTAASTLTFVHDQGVTHNRISASNLLVRSADNSAVLCGFGDATFSSNETMKAADVVALAGLLRNYIDRNHDPLRGRINGKKDGHAYKARTLLSLATVASDGETSASSFAISLRDVVEHELVSATRPPRARKFPWLVVAAVLTPIALIGLGVAGLGDKGSKAVASQSYVAPIDSCSNVNKDALPIDTDADGCPDDVILGPGTVNVNGERYVVGKPEDILAVGDWSGTGLSTLGLLRPSTGQLFVFDAWPARGKEASPRLVTTVVGATGLSSRRSGKHDVAVVAAPQGEQVLEAGRA